MTRSKTWPGSILPLRTSGSSSPMYVTVSGGPAPVRAYIGELLPDVRANRGGAAADRDVVVERRFRGGDRLVVGDTDAAHGAAWTGNGDRGAHGLVCADALEDGVDARAAGQLAHALDRFLAALAHDV